MSIPCAAAGHGSRAILLRAPLPSRAPRSLLLFPRAQSFSSRAPCLLSNRDETLNRRHLLRRVHPLVPSTMNPLRPPPSRSKPFKAGQAKAARGRAVPGAAPAAAAPGAPPAASGPAGLKTAASNPAVPAAAAYPTLQSLQAAGLAWWANSSPTEGLYPPGGFSNFLQSNGSLENFHLVGNATSTATVSPTPPSLKRTISVDDTINLDEETVNLDDDETNEDERTEKRLPWTKPEDVRLASAWVRLSKDPVDGTDRKADQYWADVTKEYNKDTEVCRRRNRNQLKIRWDRLKKPVMDFHGCYSRTTKVYRSGVSDDQLMEMAEKLYADEHKDKDFTPKHFWKVVKDERKWSAYVRKEKEKEKNKRAAKSPSQCVNLEDNLNIRPIGHKKAKAELHGKKKIPEGFSAISEKLEKYIEVTTLARKDREKMAETQQIMAKSKVEAARLSDQAAEKQLKCKMLDTYRELLLAPTSNMNAHASAEREKALGSMRLALFTTDK